jgi:hypothetical protein
MYKSLKVEWFGYEALTVFFIRQEWWVEWICDEAIVAEFTVPKSGGRMTL